MPISVDVWLSDTFVSAICAQSERNSLPLPSLLGGFIHRGFKSVSLDIAKNVEVGGEASN